MTLCSCHLFKVMGKKISQPSGKKNTQKKHDCTYNNSGLVLPRNQMSFYQIYCSLVPSPSWVLNKYMSKERKRKSVPKPDEISKYDGTMGAKAMLPATASTELQFLPCLEMLAIGTKMVVQPLSTVTTPEPCPGPAESESHMIKTSETYSKATFFFNILRNECMRMFFLVKIHL